MIAVHSVAGAFALRDCGRILDHVAGAATGDAGLVAGQRDHNMRRADLVWLDDLPGTGWVMTRIIALVRQVNAQVFGFDLDAFAESPQIARYDAARAGHFDWHSDVGTGLLAARRKLTMVVQLSPPGDYAGGVLEVMPGPAARVAARAQGCATLFPAYLPHRVTPVTGGTRLSLTVWAHGPAFR